MKINLRELSLFLTFNYFKANVYAGFDSTYTKTGMMLMSKYGVLSTVGGGGIS
jgi:hypothetical protein